jgi:hypothetical protein
VESERAFAMDPALRLAMAVAFGMFEGLEFDWTEIGWMNRG